MMDFVSGPDFDTRDREGLDRFAVGDRVLLIYPAGDCDKVEIVALTGDGSNFDDSADVKLPDGRIATVLQDDLA